MMQPTLESCSDRSSQIRPRISVIIPTHNDITTLPTVLDRVLAQDYTEFEVVIVNDAGQSPRDFLDLSDKRVRLIELLENRGVSYARNIGLKETQGEIVYFLDADDYISVDLFSIIIDIFNKFNVATVSVGMTTISEESVYENFGILESRPREKRITTLSPVETFEDFRVNSGRYIPSVTFLLRESLVSYMGEEPWKVGLRNNQDALLFLAMASRYGHAHLSDNLVIYTRRPGSLSASDPARSWTGRIQAMDLLLTRFRAENANHDLINITRNLRQGAARRAARIKADMGQNSDARDLLKEDLGNSFNWKTFAELVRQYSRLSAKN